MGRILVFYFFYWIIYSSKLSIVVFQKIYICIQEENKLDSLCLTNVIVDILLGKIGYD
jgi:hypothetical protein